jgi:hypothetical protein
MGAMTLDAWRIGGGARYSVMGADGAYIAGGDAADLETAKAAAGARGERGGGADMNDRERQDWINNDEMLYIEQRQSGLSMRAFIRANREAIDRYINNILHPSERRKRLVALYEGRHE